MNSVQTNKLTVVIIAGASRPPTFIVADQPPALPATQHPGEYRLVYGEILNLTRLGQTLYVVSGCAWITFDGQDMTLEAGQHMELKPGEDAAVVSVLGDEPLVYRICGGPEMQ